MARERSHLHRCNVWWLRCALVRRPPIQMRFLCTQMRSRLTPADPNAFPMCSDVLWLDACQSKCDSWIIVLVITYFRFHLSILMGFAFISIFLILIRLSMYFSVFNKWKQTFLLHFIFVQFEIMSIKWKFSICILILIWTTKVLYNWRF